VKLAGYTYLIEELDLALPPLGLELAVALQFLGEEL
jgi:hypothetical protein